MKVSQDFTKGPILKSLVLFAAPLFLSSLLQVVYNIVDMLIVGRYSGSAGLSAVSVGGDVTNFLTIVAMAFSNAGSVIIAQFMGAKKKDEIGRFIGTLCSFLLLVAIVLSVFGLIFTNPILSLMNTPDKAWNETVSYARICMYGLVFIYGYNIISAVLRGFGDSRHPFVFITIAAVMNIVLDMIFVAGLEMGAGGAALATVISQAGSFIISTVFLVRNRDRMNVEIQITDFIPDRKLLLTLISLGVPMALKQASVNISKLFVNSFVNSFGVTVSAVAGIGNKLNMIGNLISNATNTSGSTMVGQNIGAEKYDRVPRIIASVFLITGTASVCLVLILLGNPAGVFSLFTSESDVVKVGMEFVPIAVINFISCAFRSGANSLINGCANYKINFTVAILDGMVLRIGLGVILGIVLNFGYLGFWYGDAIASFTPFAVAVIYYISGKWKTRKYVIK